MADGQQIGRTLLIQIGDGETPEVFFEPVRSHDPQFQYVRQ